MKTVLIVGALTFGSWMFGEFIKYQKVEQVRVNQEACAWSVLVRWQRHELAKPQANRLLKKCGELHGWSVSK